MLADIALGIFIIGICVSAAAVIAMSIKEIIGDDLNG